MRDAAERLVEVRLDDRFINVKQHFALDVELDGAFVDALNLHAAVGDLLLQLFLLAVHVVTDGGTGKRTGDSTNIAAIIVINLVAKDTAGESADGGAHCSGLIVGEQTRARFTASDQERRCACQKA